MAKEYSELIKNYNNVRRYIRDFYIYGLKSRSEYNYKSSRSYDDELRRINSWLSEYVDYNEIYLFGMLHDMTEMIMQNISEEQKNVFYAKKDERSYYRRR